MRVFVTGASGFVGLGTVKKLSAAGHEVVGLAHSPQKMSAISTAGGKPVQGDLSTDAAYEHARGAEAIVHCAQSDFYTRRVSGSLIKRVGALDHQWTRKLIAAGAGKARHFVYLSGAWVYGKRQTPVDEGASLKPFKGAVFKIEGEKIALEEARRAGYASSSVIRPGSVYGPGGTFWTFILGPMLRKKSAKWIGSGDQLVSLVHRDDVGSLVAACLSRGGGFEAFNAADDEPVPARSYMGRLAELLSAPKPGGVPAFIVSVFAGAIAEALSSDLAVSNDKAKRLLGWKPSLPTWREGMPRVASEARAAAV